MQKHMIKRQIIELAVADQQSGQQIQAEVSRIFQQRLIPLLDEICTELSSPDRIHRIERLVVDLGNIDPQYLERELVERLRQAVYEALAQEIQQQDRASQSTSQHPKTQSQLELLLLFLRTGSLPWWVDTNQSNLLSAALSFLLNNAPQLLRPIMDEINQSDTSLQRLIQSFDDKQLAQLALMIMENPLDITAGDIANLSQLLSNIRRIPTHIIRRQFWLALLHVTRHIKLADSIVFYGTVLNEMVVRMGIAYTDMLDDMNKALITIATASPIENVLRSLAAATPIMPINQLTAELDTLKRQPLPMSDANVEHLMALVQTLLHHYRLAPAQQNSLAAIMQLRPNDITGDVLSKIDTITRNIAAPASDKPDISFSEADEVFIHNAGLVILFPFLTRFFDNLHLLAERQFIDEAAQQRAVGILQYLVYPQDSFAEYLLPLNKVLCGLDLTTVFDFGVPLTNDEIEACENFLEAVIEQAPILNKMSTDGFRGSFLLRKGMLSTRNGFWLLRVERETYDVVLDQFPWSWNWVKLPWMSTALQVEW